MSSVLVWLLIGLVGGGIAGALLRGRNDYGIVGYAVVGIMGSTIGGFLGAATQGWDISGFHLGSVLMAALGALALILTLWSLPGADPFE